MDTTLVLICISIVTTGLRKRGRLSPWIPPRDGQSRRVPLEREHLLRPVEANCISHSGNAFMSHIARSRSIVVTARSKEDQSEIGTAPSQQRGGKGETREEGSVDRQRKGMWKWRSLIQLVSRSVLRILLLLFRLHPLHNYRVRTFLLAPPPQDRTPTFSLYSTSSLSVSLPLTLSPDRTVPNLALPPLFCLSSLLIWIAH